MKYRIKLTDKRCPDMKGKKFGRLLVLSKAPSIKYGKGTAMLSSWSCQCDCGIIKSITGTRLRSGDTVSCGCYNRDLHRNEYGVAAFNYFFSGYKRSAKKRDIDFFLSEEEVKEIIVNDCHYCGKEPREIVTHYTKHRNIYGNLTANGMDRVDNTKGYTLDNVVACCQFCNEMKLTKTRENFLEHIIKIAKHNKLI